MELGLVISTVTHNTPPDLTRQIAIKSPQLTDLHRWYLTHCGSPSLDTDLQYPFYSVATVVLLLITKKLGRERRWPRWIKKALHIGIKRLCCGFNALHYYWRRRDRDKMASVLQTTFSMLFLEWKLLWSLKYVPRGPVSIKPAFVQIMTWHRTDKPLSESPPPPLPIYDWHIYMLTHIYASLDHNATLSWTNADLTHWGRDKWPPLSSRHFQMDFLEWKCMNFD